MAPDPVVSTGRGGKGNIGVDSNVYTDGAIVRQGHLDESADPRNDLSTGRGGAGNIGSGSGPSSRSNSHNRDGKRTDEDYVPETAARNVPYDKFHTGRGGEGNIHKDKYGGHSTAKSAAAAEREAAAKPESEGANKPSFVERVKIIFKKDGS